MVYSSINILYKIVYKTYNFNQSQKFWVEAYIQVGNHRFVLIFEIQISVDLTILENNKIKNKKNFKESFTYNNSTNKFDLKRYEKNIEDNLIKKIITKITLYLYSI